MKKGLFSNKKAMVILGGVLLLLAAGAVAVVYHMKQPKQVPVVEQEVREEEPQNLPPTLVVETPQKISLSKEEAFTVKVSVTALGEADYPAASVSISFDASRLEFLGVKEGNVFVRNDMTDTDIAQQLPTWSHNVEQCNKTGVINIMYLDTTGGKKAFCGELLAEDDNVLMRLEFRLRGSARVGDIYDLIVEDAVFAASDESLSLATLQDTLQVKDGKIVVGD